MKKTLINLIQSLSVSLLFVFCSCSSQTKPIARESKSPPPAVKILKTSSYVQENSMVRSIFEDSKGNYWLGRDHAGLSLYDGTSITHFTTQNGLCDNQIRTIQEDNHGNIWLATGSGLCKYDGRNFTKQTTKAFFMSHLQKMDKWPNSTDRLWFNGEVEGGIYSFDGSNLLIHDFPNLDSTHESSSISGTVTGICHGKNNMLWIANYEGVIGYDGESFTYINEDRFQYHVRSIFEDSKGNLWIGNNGIGVLLYDGEKTINFTDQMSKNYQLTAIGSASSTPKLFHIFAIAEDQNGNIWFGDRDTGAWRYDGEKLHNYTNDDGLSNSFVRAIYQDSEGNMLFGLGDGNVCKFNGESFEKMF